MLGENAVKPPGLLKERRKDATQQLELSARSERCLLNREAVHRHQSGAILGTEQEKKKRGKEKQTEVKGRKTFYPKASAQTQPHALGCCPSGVSGGRRASWTAL